MKDSFDLGTNVRSLDKKIARKLLIRGLVDMLNFIDANKTISGNEQLMFTVDCLIKDFPSMKIEEFFLVFRDMKAGVYGKFFERLKLAEIADCVRSYESGARCDYLEQRHLEHKSAKLPFVDYEAYRERVNQEREEAKEKKEENIQKARKDIEYELYRKQYLEANKAFSQSKTQKKPKNDDKRNVKNG